MKRPLCYPGSGRQQQGNRSTSCRASRATQPVFEGTLSRKHEIKFEQKFVPQWSCGLAANYGQNKGGFLELSYFSAVFSRDGH